MHPRFLFSRVAHSGGDLSLRVSPFGQAVFSLSSYSGLSHPNRHTETQAFAPYPANLIAARWTIDGAIAHALRKPDRGVPPQPQLALLCPHECVLACGIHRPPPLPSLQPVFRRTSCPRTTMRPPRLSRSIRSPWSETRASDSAESRRGCFDLPRYSNKGLQMGAIREQTSARCTLSADAATIVPQSRVAGHFWVVRRK